MEALVTKISEGLAADARRNPPKKPKAFATALVPGSRAVRFAIGQGQGHIIFCGQAPLLCFAFSCLLEEDPLRFCRGPLLRALSVDKDSMCITTALVGSIAGCLQRLVPSKHPSECSVEATVAKISDKAWQQIPAGTPPKSQKPLQQLWCQAAGQSVV